MGFPGYCHQFTIHFIALTLFFTNVLCKNPGFQWLLKAWQMDRFLRWCFTRGQLLLWLNQYAEASLGRQIVQTCVCRGEEAGIWLPSLKLAHIQDCHLLLQK